jgi:iron(III) transport system permease protein
VRVPVVLAVALLAMAGLAPVAAMVWESFVSGGGPTLEAYRALGAAPHPLEAMRHTLLLAAVVTAVTFAVGVPLGVLLGKSDVRGRFWLTLLLAVPLAAPPVAYVAGWQAVVAEAGAGTASFRGLWAAAWVLSGIYLPLPVALTAVLLRSVPPALEAAARLYTGWSRTLLYVTLPQLRVGLSLAALLVFVLAAGNVGVAMQLQADVYALESFTRLAAFYDLRGATAAAMPLVLLAMLPAFLQWRHLRTRPAASRLSALRPAVIRLGHGRLAAEAGLWTVVTVFTLLPVVGLVWRSAGADWTAVFHDAVPALARTYAYAAVAATAVTVVGFLTALAMRRPSLRGAQAADVMTLFLFALPGSVLALGLLVLWGRPGAACGGLSLLLAGYLAHDAALGQRVVLARLQQLPPSLEEAAAIAGAGWGMRMRHIVVPLVRRSLGLAWLGAFVFVFRDLDLTMPLYPPGQDTVAVRLLTLMANGAPEAVASLALIAICAALLPLTAGTLLLKERP